MEKYQCAALSRIGNEWRSEIVYFLSYWVFINIIAYYKYTYFKLLEENMKTQTEHKGYCCFAITNNAWEKEKNAGLESRHYFQHKRQKTSQTPQKNV